MQAARGASLSDSIESDGAKTHRPRRLGVFVLVAAVLYALDQVSKHVALDELAGRPDVRVVGELLQLRLIRNPGAAFSTGTQYTVALTCVAMVAVVVVLVIASRVRTRGWAVALGLLLAGIGGNLTDRLVRDPGPFRGHVIDFLMLPNWPIFNVADICINVGAALILIQAFRGVKLDGTRVESERKRRTAPEDPQDAPRDPAS